MNDERLRRRIQSVSPPAELEAERRAWAVVQAAYAAREPVGRRWRPAWPAALAAALVAIGVGLAATPAGPAVVDAVRDAFRSDDVQPGLESLPAPGRLLVTAGDGVWVVREDGSKRRLGDYRAASWSPAGRFVVATDRRHVVAVEPDTGDGRWSLTRPEVADARWMPVTGTRVAYRSGSTLRVVDGDGTDDRLLARRVASIAPAWRAAHENQLAHVDRRGIVRLTDVSSGGVLWRQRVGRVTALAWSADGTRLAVIGPRSARILSAAGRRIGTLTFEGGRAVAAVYSPRGRILAISLRGPEASEAVLYRGERATILQRSPGRLAGLAWSPDARFVLVGWESADEWLFLPVGGGQPTAVGEISAEFAPGDEQAGYPQIEGWVSSP